MKRLIVILSILAVATAGCGGGGGGATATTLTITASAGTGGTISPSGATAVDSGASKAFTITPDAGYIVASVTVDGTSQGIPASYTFTNVTANHTIAVTFTQIVALNVPAGAAPAGVTPTATGKTAAELPTAPVGNAFVTGAQVGPTGTAFTSPVTLTFKVATPVASGSTLRLFQYTGGNWLQIVPAIIPTVSSDGMTLIVDVSSFPDGGYFAIFSL